MDASKNPVMDVLNQCQAGQLVATLAMACDITEAQCGKALQRLTAHIARLIGDKVSDEDDYQDLLDVLDEEEEYEYLDKPNAVLGREAIADGEDILKMLYGSLDDARAAAAQIGAPEGVDDEVFARLMTLAATLALAAMARRNKQFQLAAADQSASEGGEGIMAMFVSALVAGLLQALRQAVRPRRRRRKRNILESIFGTAPKKRRRRRTSTRRRRRRRRRKSPTLNDLLGDILRG